ncbi:RNA polymerase sigma factor [Chitinophaga defluvii]|uniref:RNA polymerase sigma-70 factor n=1 Tax=Chitinophaga defluvii TaxID=3163343 RepID=A0ABV2T614_9BACT
MSLKEKDDLQLMTLMKADYIPAFNELYERYWENVFDAAFRKTQDIELSKDIVHDIFLAIWDKRTQLQIHKTLGGYLYQSLQNKIIDIKRKEVCQQKHQHTQIYNAVTDENESLHAFTTKELQKALVLEINNMPARVREVFKLSREEQMSIREIALHLSLSPQTVKNQLSYALKQLRSRLLS